MHTTPSADLLAINGSGNVPEPGSDLLPYSAISLLSLKTNTIFDVPSIGDEIYHNVRSTHRLRRSQRDSGASWAKDTASYPQHRPNRAG
uniref:Uncharacterized protein n=1 Tax=Edwardsiella tarda TaxID=636 RepID=A0A2S1PMT4_EDWTA|nr:hypothetical protein [Edwardsiella tarda]